MANGQLPKSALARAFNAAGLEVYLADDGAAAGWNTFCLYAATRKDWGTPSGNGTDSYYRSLARQQYFWRLYQQGGNLAATPGTSNHGLGHAVDCNSAAQSILHSGGGISFGWKKTEAFTEAWHYNYFGGFDRPDPGIDRKNPKISEGSGGKGQDTWVTSAQKLLTQHGFDCEADGSFGKNSVKALKEFQKARHLNDDGIVGQHTWEELRKDPKDAPKGSDNG